MKNSVGVLAVALVGILSACPIIYIGLSDGTQLCLFGGMGLLGLSMVLPVLAKLLLRKHESAGKGG